MDHDHVTGAGDTPGRPARSFYQLSVFAAYIMLFIADNCNRFRVGQVGLCDKFIIGKPQPLCKGPMSDVIRQVWEIYIVCCIWYV